MVKRYTKKIISKFLEKLEEAAKTKTSTHEIALGMCIGTFIGFLPLFGFQIIFGIIAIFLFKINKIATFLGVFITNPITTPPIFAFNYFIGKLLIGNGTPLESERLSHITGTLMNNFTINNLIALFKPIVLPLLIGSLFLGTILSIIAYFVTYKVITEIRKKLKELDLK